MGINGQYCIITTYIIVEDSEYLTEQMEHMCSHKQLSWLFSMHSKQNHYKILLDKLHLLSVAIKEILKKLKIMLIKKKTIFNFHTVRLYKIYDFLWSIIKFTFVDANISVVNVIYVAGCIFFQIPINF